MFTQEPVMDRMAVRLNERFPILFFYLYLTDPSGVFSSGFSRFRFHVQF
jgi:hypothetical protein